MLLVPLDKRQISKAIKRSNRYRISSHSLLRPQLTSKASARVATLFTTKNLFVKSTSHANMVRRSSCYCTSCSRSGSSKDSSSRRRSEKKNKSNSKNDEKRFYVCDCQGSHCECYYRKKGHAEWKPMNIKRDSDKRRSSKQKPRNRNDSRDHRYFACKCNGRHCVCRKSYKEKPRHSYEHRPVGYCHGHHCSCSRRTSDREWVAVIPSTRNKSRFLPLMPSNDDKFLRDLLFS